MLWVQVDNHNKHLKYSFFHKEGYHNSKLRWRKQRYKIVYTGVALELKMVTVKIF